MNPLTPKQQKLADLFQQHVNAELKSDLSATMETMSEDPHVNHVPTMIGGIGWDAVHHFYTTFLEGEKFFPPDTEMQMISRTIDEHQLVDEMIFKFTHTSEIAWMLPNIAPTGKRVEIPLVVIVGFANGKVTHEHIYWDQASVLVQLGLIDKSLLPVYGIETSHKMADIQQRYFK